MINLSTIDTKTLEDALWHLGKHRFTEAGRVLGIGGDRESDEYRTTCYDLYGTVTEELERRAQCLTPQ